MVHIINFFDIDLGRKCPFLIGVFNLKYLNSIGEIYLEHVNSNMELTNQHLNKQLEMLTNIPNLQILKVKYVALSFLPTIRIDSDFQIASSFMVINEFDYCIFNESLIFCVENHGTRHNFVCVLSESIIHILKERDPSVEEKITLYR